MKKKDTPPKQGNKDNTKHNTINLTPTQRLAVEYILEHPDCNRWQLGAYIETGYAPDIIQYVRKKGIDIKTKYVPYTKRCGKETRIGLYSVKPNSMEKAQKAIES